MPHLHRVSGWFVHRTFCVEPTNQCIRGSLFGAVLSQGHIWPISTPTIP